MVIKNKLGLDLESEKSGSPDAAMLYAVPFHFFFWKLRWKNFLCFDQTWKLYFIILQNNIMTPHEIRSKNHTETLLKNIFARDDSGSDPQINMF